MPIETVGSRQPGNACNLRTWEAKEGGSLKEKGQPGFRVRYCLKKQNETKQDP